MNTTSSLLTTWATTQAEEDLMNDDHRPFWQRMIQLAVQGSLKDQVVLDFGCNQGGFLATLYGQSPFKSAVGVDLAQASLALARQRNDAIPAEFHVPEKLAELNDTFDLAFSHEVLYLLPSLEEHARTIHAALKSGGVYYAAIGCHTDQPLWPHWRKYIAQYSNITVQNYSLDDYANAFLDQGFEVGIRPLGIDGFVPLSKSNDYFPTVDDSLRYYFQDKQLLQCIKKHA